MEDYAVVMAILNRNLSEGADEFPPVEEPEQPPSPKPALPDIRSQAAKADVESIGTVASKRKVLAAENALGAQQKSKIHVQMKFSFLFDGVIINLLLSKYSFASKLNKKDLCIISLFHLQTTRKV